MRSIFTWFIILSLAGCVNEFNPNLSDAPTRLVVEGSITNEDGPYFVKLSQTRQLDFEFFEEQFEAAQNAIVIISDDLNNSEQLIETTPGLYSTSGGNKGIRGEVGRRYQLSIQTVSGSNYLSRWEEMLPVPKLDSITIELESMETSIDTPLEPNSIFNLDFNTSTEDSTNYFPDVGATTGRTEYNGVGGFLIGTELSLTSISSLSESNVGLRLGIFANDPADQRNFYLWRVRGIFDVFTQPDRHVVLGDISNPNASVQFRNFYWVPKDCCARCWINFDLGSLYVTDDRLKNGQRFFERTAILPVTSFIFQNNLRIEIEQSSLNFEAYQFFRGVEKQIDEVGSIFDTAPSLSVSNISNPQDPEDLVLGYFVVSAVSVKTKWINRRDIPVGVGAFIYSDDCLELSNSVMTSTTNRPEFWPD